MSEILTSLPAVAQKIHTHCKKCDVDRYQVVLAHPTKTSAKIQCEVCKAKSTFKLAKPKKPVIFGKAPRKSAAVKSIAAQYEELKGKTDISKAQPYKMTGTFSERAVIAHPKFGVGFVTNALASSIEVIFEDAQRNLIHNRQS